MIHCEWKENHSITMFRYYFRINKGHDFILMVDDANTSLRGDS